MKASQCGNERQERSGRRKVGRKGSEKNPATSEQKSKAKLSFLNQRDLVEN